MHGHAYGLLRRAVRLLSIRRQREEVILNQVPQPVLYVQQQAVKLISGSGVDIQRSLPFSCSGALWRMKRRFSIWISATLFLLER